jgi:hypothetical protein
VACKVPDITIVLIKPFAYFYTYYMKDSEVSLHAITFTTSLFTFLSYGLQVKCIVFPLADYKWCAMHNFYYDVGNPNTKYL